MQLGGVNLTLFINNEKHPDVYTNNNKVVAPNQGVFKSDFLSELVEKQQKANDLLQQSLRKLEKSFDNQEHALAIQSKKISSQIYNLRKMNYQQEEFEGQIEAWMRKTETENRKHQDILDNRLLVEEELLEEMKEISLLNQKNERDLENYGFSNDELIVKIDEQFDLQKQIADQLVKQEQTQNEVLSRLDNQEAISEKILRQIDYFRSVLFERTHYLAEKIENGYTTTSSYIYKLVKGSEQPVAHFKINKKEDR